LQTQQKNHHNTTAATMWFNHEPNDGDGLLGMSASCLSDIQLLTCLLPIWKVMPLFQGASECVLPSQCPCIQCLHFNLVPRYTDYLL